MRERRERERERERESVNVRVGGRGELVGGWTRREGLAIWRPHSISRGGSYSVVFLFLFFSFFLRERGRRERVRDSGRKTGDVTNKEQPSE